MKSVADMDVWVQGATHKSIVSLVNLGLLVRTLVHEGRPRTKPAIRRDVRRVEVLARSES